MCAKYAEELETKGSTVSPAAPSWRPAPTPSAAGLTIAARRVLTQQDGHVWRA